MAMAEMWRAELRAELVAAPGTSAGRVAELEAAGSELWLYVLDVFHSGTEAEVLALAEAAKSELLAAGDYLPEQLDVYSHRDKAAEFWQFEAARDEYHMLMAAGGVAVNMWQALLDEIDKTAAEKVAGE